MADITWGTRATGASAVAAAAAVAMVAMVALPMRAHAAPPSSGSPHPAGLRAQVQGIPLAHLQAGYLQCAATSAHTRLSTAEMNACGVLADALLQRQFGGDFNALIAWWHAQNADRAPMSGAGATQAVPSPTEPATGDGSEPSR